MARQDDLIAQLGRLDHASAADPARLLGMIVALAGEVFVMKAQLERLTRAVAAVGVSAERLLQEGETEAMRRWLEAEEREFTRAVLEPFVRGDSSVNATSFMRGE